MSSLNIWKVGPDVKIRDTDGEVPIATNDLVTQDELTAELATKSDARVGTLVPMPVGTDWTPVVNVYRDAQGYFTDYQADDFIVPSAVTYYLAPDGNDANSGLTADAPKRSLDALIAALNSAPPSGATIYLEPGLYLNSNGMVNRSINFPCNLICESGQAIIANTRSVTWSNTPDPTFTNTYTGTTTASDTNNSIIDLLDRDEHNLPRRFENLATADEVNDYPGSTNHASTTVRVRLRRSGAPDSNVLHLSSTSTLVQTTANPLYVRGLHFWGGAPTVSISATGAVSFTFEDCSFGYSPSLDAITCTLGSHEITFVRCVAAYASNDGFDYRSSVRGIELNCSAYRCGFAGVAAGSDNATTAHNSARTLRVNGLYTDCRDRIVHDVNTTQNVLIACKAGRSYSSGTNLFDRVSFALGSAASPELGRTWLIDCESLGGVLADIGCYGLGVLEYSGSIMELIDDVSTIRRIDSPELQPVVVPTEWIAETVSQLEAEQGTATTRRAWTAQRVAQAIAAQSGSGILYSDSRYFDGQALSIEVTPQFLATGYQWYELVANVWTLLVGETSSDLDLGTLNASDDGRVFRCEVVGPSTTIISKPFVLEMWTPLDLGSDLFAWLDPDLSVFIERTGISATTPSEISDSVGTWRTQGTAINVIALADGQRPIRSTGFLTFDGSDDRLQVPISISSATRNAAYTYVFQALKPKSLSVTSTSFSVAGLTSLVRTAIVCNQSNTAGRLGLAARQLDAGSSVTIGANSQFVNDEEFIVSAEFLWAQQLIQLRKNGIVAASGSHGNGSPTSDTDAANSWIGHQASNSTWLTGGIGTTIICKTSNALSDSTRSLIESYIAFRHGISI